jgi:hypothetical protein
MAYRGTVILRYVGNRSTPEPLPTPIYNVPPIPLPDWSIGDVVTYSVPSTERLLNAKHFSRLPPKSVARQEALWQDTLREGSVRALCQGREYNSSGLTCHLKEAVRARNSIGAWMDGTIVLDDGLTTWNPDRAREFLEKL